ncbi:NAD(P)H-dependent oxidoreductase [Bizionia argentinensis JUB59]|uniref:NAD(P)H-dependent oxidoreductase n=1 Tax=Bizionia argentinensis JUB59 TaxID=1046627 RepID=G2E8Z7_9FLAO|nr:NAD(P)H-dependent oxidoreductase [Bizionia argentinensis]EGV45007.1 NAD(P)H-dependent oxidoreductase [Bizionia argentinensis JUB59]
MEIIEKLNWRYATKAFDLSKKVSSEKLEIIKQAFNLTATSYGLQPIKLVIVSNPLLKKELVSVAFNQKQLEQASHVLVLCIQTSIDEEFVLEYFNRVHNIRETPKTILKPFQDFLISDFENKLQEGREAWATNQAYLALGNLLTVCALEGIDSCPMEGFKPEVCDDLLDLREKNLKSVLLLPIGYRAEDDMFSDFKKVRKSITDSIIEM